MRVFLTFASVAIAAAFITYGLHRLFVRNKAVKYLPALILFVLTVFSFVRAITSHGTFEDLGFIVLAMMSFTGFLSGLILSLIIDFVIPGIRKRRQ